jgi:negative regulator of flagellin synthesis FlgM
MINPVNGYSSHASSGKTNTEQTKQLDQVKQSTQQAASKPDAQAKSDSVELSSSARMMKAAEDSIKNMPAVDQEKVDRIKTAIRDGEYQINHESLAVAMKNIESEF